MRGNYRCPLLTGLATILLPLSVTASSLATGFRAFDSPSIATSQFGASIAAQNGTAVVGAWSTGSAFIYDDATGKQLRRLIGSGVGVNDLFGVSVALDGNVALVGASGGQAVYVFNAQTGQQTSKLTESNPNGLGRFGFGVSVGVAGNLAVVGDPGVDNLVSSSGGAYVYDLTSGQLLHTFLSQDFGQESMFGSSVAIQGHTMVVGASGGTGKVTYSGAAYVYDAITGAQISKLVATDGTSFSEFGSSVAMAGNYVMVGAWGYSSRGAAYLFDLRTGQQLQEFFPPGGTVTAGGFSRGLAFDGHFALIGDYTAQPGGQFRAGSAYLYDAFTGQLLATYLPAEIAHSENAFGISTAIDGRTLIFGASQLGGGRVYAVEVPEPTSCAEIASAALCLCFVSLARRRWRSNRGSC